MGGESAEREVSLKSGDAVYQRTAWPQESTRSPWICRAIYFINSPNSRSDRVFNLLHGRGGEDGRIQRGARLSSIYLSTGSGVCASALNHG